jgi:hypothetical protein
VAPFDLLRLILLFDMEMLSRFKYAGDKLGKRMAPAPTGGLRMVNAVGVEIV